MISWLATDYFQQSPVLFAPVVGLLLFLALFVGVVVYAARLRPDQIDAYGKLPLDSEKDHE